MDYDAVMRGDPKNPNAWWAVPLRLPKMLVTFGKAQKRRLVWLVPIVIVIGAIEIFFFNRMLHS